MFVEGAEKCGVLALGCQCNLFDVALFARCFRVAVKCLLEFLDVGFKRELLGLCRSSLNSGIDFMNPDLALPFLSGKIVQQRSRAFPGKEAPVVENSSFKKFCHGLAARRQFNLHNEFLARGIARVFCDVSGYMGQRPRSSAFRVPLPHLPRLVPSHSHPIPDEPAVSRPLRLLADPLIDEIPMRHPGASEANGWLST